MKKSFAIFAFLIAFAGITLAQECILGEDGPGGDPKIITGVPNNPNELVPEELYLYSITTSIPENWDGGCRAGSHISSQLCQLEENAPDSGAGCSVLNQNHCHEQLGCFWDQNTCAALADLENEEQNPLWPVECSGYDFLRQGNFNDQQYVNRQRQYCNDIEDESACEYKYAGLGDDLNFVYQFKWRAGFGEGDRKSVV